MTRSTASPTTVTTPTPSASEQATTPEASPSPSTPEEKVDALAAQHGWKVDDYYDSASALVDDLCTTLDDLDEDDGNRAQWLVDGDHVDGDDGRIAKAGAPIMCPRWSKTVRQAVAGTYEHWYTDGKYEVGKDIKPGTYRTKGDLSDCYWERLTRSGEIIANNFATAAREIVVTVRASDGMFTSEGCGTWKPVK